jgi:hypothetical protein
MLVQQRVVFENCSRLSAFKLHGEKLFLSGGGRRSRGKELCDLNGHQIREQGTVFLIRLIGFFIRNS